MIRKSIIPVPFPAAAAAAAAAASIHCLFFFYFRRRRDARKWNGKHLFPYRFRPPGGPTEMERNLTFPLCFRPGGGSDGNRTEMEKTFF